MASSVSTTTNRHGREWCGAGARHAASTIASRSARGDRLGRERADRPAGLDERGNATLTGRGPRRSGGSARAPSPRATRRGSTPRTIATGTFVALPITSSAADAISSATATSVTCRTRPSASVRVAQVDDRRDAAHADRDVGEAAPPRPAERVGDDHRDLDAARGPAARRGRAWPTGRRRRAAARPSPCSTFERSTPAFAHTKPCAVSLMMRSPRRRTMRTDSDSTSARRASRSSGSSGTSRFSAFDTIFCVTTRQSPSRERRALGAGRVGDEHGELVAGTDLADALDRDDGERHATAASVSAASAAAISGLRIIVSVTTACTPGRLDLGGPFGVDRVDHQRAADLGVGAGDADARHLDAERAPSAGRPGPSPARRRRSGSPPTTRSRRATSTSRTPGTARIGPIEITGFDGQITIVSARRERLEHARRRAGPRSAPSKRTDDDGRLGPLADEPRLHRELFGAAARRAAR